jgi:2,3-bisphosphoglycerate-independent phosphoglycerate mutase
MAKQQGVEQVFVHCFMDGRDTPPESGAGFIEQLQKQMRRSAWANRHRGRAATTPWIATSAGSAWSARSTPWCSATAKKDRSRGRREARSYERGVTDEFIEPVTIVDARNEPVGLIRDDDACIFFNFRADRGREMTKALTRPRSKNRPALVPKNLKFTTMTEYDKSFRSFRADARASQQHPGRRHGAVELEEPARGRDRKVRARDLLFQRRQRKALPGEEREMVPSPKVATYDLKPEMSAQGITECVVEAIEQADFDVIVMNFANADMVGHSGKMEPTVRAWKPWTRPRPDLRQRCKEKADAGSSPPITATPRR